jgi:hypothetical protein
VIASIETQLGGHAEFDWRSEGLICRLSVPLKPSEATRQRVKHQNPAINGGGTELAARSADA